MGLLVTWLRNEGVVGALIQGIVSEGGGEKVGRHSRLFDICSLEDNCSVMYKTIKI